MGCDGQLPAGATDSPNADIEFSSVNVGGAIDEDDGRCTSVPWAIRLCLVIKIEPAPQGSILRCLHMRATTGCLHCSHRFIRTPSLPPVPLLPTLPPVPLLPTLPKPAECDFFLFFPRYIGEHSDGSTPRGLELKICNNVSRRDLCDTHIGSVMVLGGRPNHASKKRIKKRDMRSGRGSR